MTQLSAFWRELLAVVSGGLFMCAIRVWAKHGFPFDPSWLPALLVLIDVATAVGYACMGGWDEWRKVVYWLAAATLTTVVTW